jgi:D-glycero-alpha-D-manno-heptose 1-phosphate guanylyltransferase
MLVLAGGFGTRLQSVVTDVPKALAPVGHLPFLHLQIEHWIAQGVRSFVFLLCYQADLIINFLEISKKSLLKNCTVQWVIELTPLDTGGAVAHAVQQLDLSGDFLLTNADTWLGSGFQAVAQSSVPALAVLHMNDASRYGQVQFGDEFHVTDFSEKGGHAGSGWINAGLCHLHVDFFMDWNGLPFSLERVLLSQLADSGALTAVTLQTDFIDIGIPADYVRFCEWIDMDRKGKLCN